MSVNFWKVSKMWLIWESQDLGEYSRGFRIFEELSLRIKNALALFQFKQ